jgi:hypothetical protein
MLFYNLQIWEHNFEHGPHLSATAISKLFSTLKLVMRTPALEVLKVHFVEWSANIQLRVKQSPAKKKTGP